MKLCPLCQHCYEDKFNTCVHDQTPLVQGRPGACLVAQKYSLDRLLDGGTAQAVYAGRHLETDRPYAIELLLPEPEADAETLKNFRRAALAAAHLNTRVDHQHAAKTYDYGLLPDGTVYVVTELVAGRSLRQHMDEAGPLPVAVAVRVARQIADGLQAAHRCGIVHRCLEPSNIILALDYDQNLEAKIVNFGFANLLRQGTEGKGRGVPPRPCEPASPYVAPERRSDRNTDALSDIYSMGVILFEMLTGQLPSGDGVTTTAGQDKGAELSLLAQFRDDVPEPLARLVTQQLQVRPSARPHGAAEVARRLRAVENLLATGQAVAPAEDIQLPAAELTALTDGFLTSHPPTPDAATKQAAQSSTDSSAGAREADTEGDAAADYDDLDALQEELGRNLDEIIDQTSTPATLRGRLLHHPSSATPSKPSPAASPRADAPRRKAPGGWRPTLPLYAALAAVILGLGCGLWISARNAPASAPAPPQSTQAASAETLAVVAADEPSSSDVSSTSVEARDETPTATPDAVVDSAPRRPPEGDEGDVAPGRNEREEREAKPSAPTPEPRREPNAAGPEALAAREPRQEGGRCTLSVSDGSLSIRAGGSDTLTVSVRNATGRARVTASTNHWRDIAVFSDSQSGGTVRYSVISVSKRAGTFAVNFKSPCGAKTVPVNVK